MIAYHLGLVCVCQLIKLCIRGLGEISSKRRQMCTGSGGRCVKMEGLFRGVGDSGTIKWGDHLHVKRKSRPLVAAVGAANLEGVTTGL